MYNKYLSIPSPWQQASMVDVQYLLTAAETKSINSSSNDTAWNRSETGQNNVTPRTLGTSGSGYQIIEIKLSLDAGRLAGA